MPVETLTKDEIDLIYELFRYNQKITDILEDVNDYFWDLLVNSAYENKISDETYFLVLEHFGDILTMYYYKEMRLYAINKNLKYI